VLLLKLETEKKKKSEYGVKIRGAAKMGNSNFGYFI